MDDRQRITSITTWIVGVVAGAVALLLPLGFFAISYHHLAGTLEAEAEAASRTITELINANPELWKYEQRRLEEVLTRRIQGSHSETRRILDRQNRLVAERAELMKPPLIRHEFELLDSGIPVGKIEIISSLSPLLLRSGLVALLGLFCGAGIFIVLRVFPLRTIEQVEKSLRLSEEELTVKVMQLEGVLAKMKQLEGIIPICMYCKKIRDDKESWQQLEGYISEHSEAHFSHGICPDCYRKVSGDFLDELENLKQV